uniref:Retrotransposon gag domain-containing protein n=1 Tax=Cannabis sativa TaxID=3483 RepID=A0A803PJA6_CANSA
MRRNRSATPLTLLNPEIERTLKQSKAKKKIDFTMAAINNNNSNGLNNNQSAPAAADAQPRAVRDYCLPVVNKNLTGIANPVIAANNFELKPALINMVQQNHFGGLATKDPNIHLAIFLEVCATMKMNGLIDDAIKLRLFPFSLRDKAKSWLQSLQLDFITTWDEIARKFMVKFWPYI